MGVSLALLGSACYGLRFASVLRCATHCSRTLRMPHAAAFECFILSSYIHLLYLV
ncbi:MAG: hypothetical protein NZ455_01500 [Bacteroidia bacterium]|nr:hypothetical protein [Bacteroidia bacterium]MDW8346819.1 hypothetical protein [Bacteroidia bacterium]